MKDASGFGYEKLLVWQRSVEWVCKIINAAGSIDTARKHYRLVEQLEAASASVSMNIADYRTWIDIRGSNASGNIPQAQMDRRFNIK